MADAPVPRRRRRWLRRGLVVLLLLAILTYFAPWIAARTGLAQRLLQQALAEVDGTASFAAISLGWFHPVEVTQLQLLDAQQRPLAEVERLETDQSLLALLINRSNLGTLTLHRPRVIVESRQGVTNWETSLHRILQKPRDPAATPPRLTIKLRNALLQVACADTDRQWQFDGVESTITLGPTTGMKLEVPAPDRLQLDATFDRQFAAAAQAEGFPIEPLTMLLQRFEPGLQLAGRLTGQVATDTQEGTAVVAGAFTLRDFAAASPRLGRERITLKTLDLPFKINITGPEVRIDHARLSSSLGSLTAQGQFDLSQPLEHLLQQPRLRAAAQINLAELAAAMPELLRLQPGTEVQEGQIELHLASQASDRGVVWSGQLKTTSLRGRRHQRELRWHEPIIASFLLRLDDQLHPEFDQLEAVSDFATLSARGRYDNFQAHAEISLDALAKHLRDFIDLEGITLAGSARLSAQGTPEADAAALSGKVDLNNFAAAAADWHFAARGTLAANLRLQPASIRCDDLQGTLEHVRFRGFGLNVDEPLVKVLPTNLTMERATGLIIIPKLQAASQTVSIGAEDLRCTSQGVNLHAAVNLDLFRFRSLLRLDGEPFGGIVRGGQFTLTAAPEGQRFTARWPIEQFYFGPARQPHWTEPTLTLLAEGRMHLPSGLLVIEQAVIERPDGVALTAAGRVSDLNTTPQLDFTGQIRYDLAALQPQLQAMLGSGFRAAGRDQRPFTLRGSTEQLNRLTADASIAWQAIEAYGFEVGPATLQAQLQNGLLQSNTIVATFGGTGRIQLQPTLDLHSLTLALPHGRIIERATVTPQATAAALGFALPPIARSTQAAGTISFDLQDHHLPLNNINAASLQGRLILHDLSVVPGPIITALLELLENRPAQLTLAREQTVPIRVERGRVYHEQLHLTFANTTLTTRGSVGFDGSLQLVVETPLPPSAIGPLLRNTPAIREAALNKRIEVTIGGTLERPMLDRQAFQAAVAHYVREVSRDAARGALGNLLQKALEPPPPKKP